MNERWHIYREGEALGPFTAVEIRAQLRAGEVDPFDLVGREGSTLRRELVEVDELFARADASDDAKPFSLKSVSDGTSAVASATGQRRINRVVASEANTPEQRGFIPSAEAMQRNLHLASAEAVQATRVSRESTPIRAPEPVKRRRKDPKHFNLRDGKGRVWGPLSASEIQNLFYKGIVDKKVVVLKESSTAVVPVDKFVAVFAQSKGGVRQRQQGAHPALVSATPHLTTLQSLALAQSLRMEKVRVQRLITKLLMVAAFALLALSAWLVIKKSGSDWVEKIWESGPTNVLRNSIKDRKISPPRAELKSPLPQRPVVASTQKPASAAAVTSKPPARVDKPTNATGSLRKERNDRRRQPARDKRQVREKSRTSEARAEKKRRQEARRLARAPLVAAKKPAPVVQPSAAPAKPAGTNLNALTDGQQVTRLGPLHYDPAAIAQCTGACVISFSGFGGSVSGRFFKDGFGEALAARKGSAYITGIVRKTGSSAMILIQDVQ